MYDLFAFRTISKPGKIARKPFLGLKKSLPKSGKLLDARVKIIQKKRHKIRDAREIIAENARKSIKDARELLSTPKVLPQTKKSPKRATIPRSRPIRKATQSSDIFMDDEEEFDITHLRELNLKPVGSIKRTVHNEMFRTVPPITMPKLPHFNINQDMSRLSPDPFDCYVVPTRLQIPIPRTLRPERIERFQPGRVMSAHMDAYEPRKSILRSARSADHDDRYDDDRYFSSSSDNVRSRLYKDSREARNESAGIFAKLPVRGTSPPSAQIGHRIVVSNLHNSVTESDVRELFEDCGPLISTIMVRPGVAEVVFKNLGEAEIAIETYHNRQLDGQPMKCLLVKSSAKPYSRL